MHLIKKDTFLHDHKMMIRQQKIAVPKYHLIPSLYLHFSIVPEIIVILLLKSKSNNVQALLLVGYPFSLFKTKIIPFLFFSY